MVCQCCLVGSSPQHIFDVSAALHAHNSYIYMFGINIFYSVRRFLLDYVIAVAAIMRIWLWLCHIIQYPMIATNFCWIQLMKNMFSVHLFNGSFTQSESSLWSSDNFNQKYWRCLTTQNSIMVHEYRAAEEWYPSISMQHSIAFIVNHRNKNNNKKNALFCSTSWLTQ